MFIYFSPPRKEGKRSVNISSNLSIETGKTKRKKQYIFKVMGLQREDRTGKKIKWKQSLEGVWEGQIPEKDQG